MNPWKIISDQEVDAIHDATLRVFSEVAIVLDHPQIREQLVDSGATLSGARVPLPSPLPQRQRELQDGNPPMARGYTRPLDYLHRLLEKENIPEHLD